MIVGTETVPCVPDRKNKMGRERNKMSKRVEEPKELVPETKQICRDALHMLQQAKHRTKQTDELEELVHLSGGKKRGILTSQVINHDNRTQSAKRRPSSQEVHAESKSCGYLQHRYKNRMRSWNGKKTGGQGKDAPNHEEQFTGDLPHDIKGLHKDALHTLQQAIDLTQQTDELEELIRIPREKPRNTCPPQVNIQLDPVRFAKRRRSDRYADAEPHVRDGDRRQKNRTCSRYDAEIGRQRKGVSSRPVRRLSWGLCDSNEELYTDTLRTAQQAKMLTQQTDEQEECLELHGGTNDMRSIRFQGTSTEDVARGTRSHRDTQLVHSGKSQSSQNKGSHIHSMSCARQAREITRQETDNCKELFQEAMEALEAAKELTRCTDELEYMVNLPDYIRRKKLSKPIILSDQ